MFVLGIDTATPAIATAVVALDAPVPIWNRVREAHTVPDRMHQFGSAIGNRPAPTSGARLLVERRTVDARAHAERLTPQIAEALASAGLRPADLAAIVAGTGPGPFTGLRVGLATAAAMGQALAIPTYGVCSLDGIGGPAGGRVLVATDARRRELYWAVYADGARLTEPAVDPPAVVAKEAARLGVREAVGEGAHRYAEQLGIPVRSEWTYPSPYALVRLAASRIGTPSERLVPRYLRRPDAAEPRPPKPVTGPLPEPTRPAR